MFNLQYHNYNYWAVFNRVKYLFKTILQDWCSNKLPFGGKVVVLSGDFRQVLPVIPKASRAHVVSMTILKWEGWAKVQIRTLTENMRIKRMIGSDVTEQKEFNQLVNVTYLNRTISIHANYSEDFFYSVRLLMDIGNQSSPLRFGEDGPEVKYAKLPSDMFVTSEEELIQQTFPNLETERANNRAILCPLNIQVNAIHVSYFKKNTNFQFTL